jgi:type I restriction enzyme S subunit
MGSKEISLADAVEFVVDNRGKTVPIQESGFPLIATNCINNKNLYPEFINVRYVSEEILENWFRSHPKPNDIILTNKGSQNGAICMVPNPVSFCIAQDMVALRAKTGEVYPHYLFAALRSNLVQDRMKNLNVDSVIPHFKKTDFNKLFFPLPEYKIQVEIGDCYFNFCKKIELNRQLNQTLEHMAQALFKSWFVDFDPVIDNALAAGNVIPDDLQDRAERRQLQLAKADHKPLPENICKLFPSEFELTESLGWVPKGWCISNVGECFDVTMGQSPPGSTYNEDRIGLPFFQGRTDFGFRYPANRIYCTEPKRLGKKGHTLISVRAPVGDINIAVEDCCIGRGVASAIHKSGATSYTYYSMNQLSEHFKIFEGEGTVFGSINQKDFNAIPLLKKPEPLIKEFEKIAEKLDEKIRLCSESINVLSQLRDTLLPKLISGELRIPEAQAQLEEALV